MELEVQHPVPLTYPELTLWDRNIPVEKRIRVVNKIDFPLQDIIQGLGLGASPLAGSFGITDVTEIRARQSLIKFFVKNPNMIELVKRLSRGVSTNLPSSEPAFLNYYNTGEEHNDYWTKVHELVDALESFTALPPRLNQLLRVLRSTMVAESDELRMADFITDRIINMAVFEGSLVYSLYIEHEDDDDRTEKSSKRQAAYVATSISRQQGEAHGHTLYSFDAASYESEPYPDWAHSKKDPRHWVGISKLARILVDKKNKANLQKAYDAMSFSELSDALGTDIERGLLEELQKIRLTRRFQGGTVRVYFSYDSSGLQIMIYAIEPKISESEIFIPYAQYEQFTGYNEEQKAEILKRMTEFNNDAYIGQKALLVAEALRVIVRQEKDFLSTMRGIPSPRTDREHRWFALSNLYRDALIAEVVEAVKLHRSFVLTQATALCQIAEIAELMMAASAKHGMPLCFPEIVADDGHVVEFDEMLPGNLLSKMEKGELPVPIGGLEPINGRIIGLTGAHGGGKTVTSLTVAELIYLAQSGLPVLGRGIRLNVKEVLGLVFIERGEGSTIQRYLTKVHAVLESIKDTDGRRVVIVLDELGSATQEADGLKMGRELLASFAQSGVSVVYSTQIMALAEYSETELDAICYKMSRDHSMSPGVSDGGLEELMSSMGITQLLNN